MPTYIYRTYPSDPTTPTREFELVQKMSDAPLTQDPESG